MNTSTMVHHEPFQNIGLADRLFRLAVGIAMLAVAYYLVVTTGSKATLWDTYALLLSVYPILTGAMGWDPFYAIFHVKSCALTGKNQCGTLPYQIKTMTGHAPQVCDITEEHSLESCHDEGVERPHHKMWRVNQDPMLYPDDADWEDYLKRQRAKKTAGS